MSSDEAKSARARALDKRGAFHPVRIGRTVTILRLGRRPSIEGRAVVRKPAPAPNCYWVEFFGDPMLRERVVHPDYQPDPERMLAVLRDLWRADVEPFLSDFFPNDI